jgi:potassium voltage-gated channel Shaker-related subfamily A protein 1
VSTIREFLEIEGLLLEDPNFVDVEGIKMKVWNLFEYPESSAGAKVVSIISVCAILISTTIFCMETMPYYKPKKRDFINYL